MADAWKMIDDQIGVLRPFYDQVDKARKRLNLTPYKLKSYPDKAGKEHNMDDVVNVTENSSASYMTRVIAGLMSGRWQTVVEGSFSMKDAHRIEQFIDASLQQADEYLLDEYGLASLDSWLSNHVCHTTLIGVQWVGSVEDGEYKIRCLPCDMRWTPFVLNKWVAPITFRAKEDLLAELEDYQKTAMDSKSDDYSFKMLDGLKDTGNEVRDAWFPDRNELWVNGGLVFKQPNVFGKLPFVIIWPPTGFMFRGEDYLANEAPSLLFLNERLYDQLSRQLSIDATLGFNALNPAMEYETANPDGGPSRARPKSGEDLAVPQGELHRPVPTPDINRAELVSREQISRMIDQAAPVSPRAYNSPPSAVEVATEVELLGELQNPRIIGLQMFKARLARLMIEQVITLGTNASFMVGGVGRQASFTVADLKDPKKYAINYQLNKRNKRLDIVNESRALALWGRAPIKYILRDVLGVEDPDGWQREIEMEKAKAANPALALAEMAVRYAEEAEDLEGDDKEFKNWQSMILTHDCVQLMKQRLQPASPQETQNLREATKETSNAQGLISLLGTGGGSLVP